MGREYLYYVPLLALLIVAAATDLRARRIPNWLSVGLALSGIALSFTQLGSLSPGQALLGMSVGLGIGFVMFLLGAWGAGDAKLLSGIGAWLGAASVLWVTAGAAIIAMFVVLAYSMLRGRLRMLLRDSAMLGIELSSGSVPSTALASAESLPAVKARTLPLAVPMLVATAGLLAVNLARGS